MEIRNKHSPRGRCGPHEETRHSNSHLPTLWQATCTGRKRMTEGPGPKGLHQPLFPHPRSPKFPARHPKTPSQEKNSKVSGRGIIKLKIQKYQSRQQNSEGKKLNFGLEAQSSAPEKEWLSGSPHRQGNGARESAPSAVSTAETPGRGCPRSRGRLAYRQGMRKTLLLWGINFSQEHREDRDPRQQGPPLNKHTRQRSQ